MSRENQQLMKTYTFGEAPLACGQFVFDEWHEYMHYLYLPIYMPSHGGLRIPPRLQFLFPMIDRALEQEGHVFFPGSARERPEDRIDWYVYITARRGWASPDNPLNRPGWHSDGFGSDDINYVWTDRFPTRYAIQQFTDISTDHVQSLEQFAEQLDPSAVVECRVNELLRLDPSVIHATPIVPPPGGERSFVKISMSPSKYNLSGNSHNYLFDYDWKMWSRSEIRNDPRYAGGDSVPETT